MRVESARRLRNGGWLHRAGASRFDPGWRRIPIRTPATALGFGALAEQFHSALNPFELIRLAAELGVSRDSLTRLRIGWDGGAWTFPMVDASGRVIGIRRRLPDGRKLAVRSGREGCFVPRDLAETGVVYIAEGPTDCAALLTLGLASIGRPSCRGGVGILHDLVRGRDVVIVSDADLPGQRGAADLADPLALVCSAVRIIQPPEPFKDARAWVNAGAAHGDVLALVEAADPIRIGIIGTVAAGH